MTTIRKVDHVAIAVASIAETVPLFCDTLQGEFIARNAAQCGFCSSGMLLTAYELVASGRKMSRTEIREFISGNMCRCTGYHAIVDAICETLDARAGRVRAGVAP